MRLYLQYYRIIIFAIPLVGYLTITDIYCIFILIYPGNKTRAWYDTRFIIIEIMRFFLLLARESELILIYFNI